jgi:hypothetical protein
MLACLTELCPVCRQPWPWPVRSFGSGGWPAQASCPCSPALIRGGFSWSVWTCSGSSRVCPGDSVQCYLWHAAWLCVSV